MYYVNIRLILVIIGQIYYLEKIKVENYFKEYTNLYINSRIYFIYLCIHE